jgi:integration host factor subunit beta
MHTITKKDLTDKIAEEIDLPRITVKKTIQLFLDEITGELAAGNRLEFREFGIFEPVKRKARNAQNPKTLEKVAVPQKATVKFKQGRLMKIKINENKN